VNVYTLAAKSQRTIAMRSMGRGLQYLGLALLPLSMIMEITDGLGRSFGVSQMLVMLVFGAAVFYLGRLVEGYSRGA
jgi:hypothetical protein